MRKKRAGQLDLLNNSYPRVLRRVGENRSQSEPSRKLSRVAHSPNAQRMLEAKAFHGCSEQTSRLELSVIAFTLFMAYKSVPSFTSLTICLIPFLFVHENHPHQPLIAPETPPTCSHLMAFAPALSSLWPFSPRQANNSLLSLLQVSAQVCAF